MEINHTGDDMRAMGRMLAEELYQKGLRALEDELTVENYSEQMAKIEKYKHLHRH